MANVGDEYPRNLLKLYIIIKIYKKEYEHLMKHFDEHLRLYVIIKLIFETLILKIDYYVKQIG